MSIMIIPPSLEDGLDDVSGGRIGWQQLLEAFWKDFKPKAGEVMEQQPSAVTAALDEFLAPWLFPEKADGSDPRICPACGTGRLALRGGKFGSFVACANYPECKYTQKFGQGGDAAVADGPTDLGEGVIAAQRALRALCPAGRREGCQEGVDPQGRRHRRADAGDGAETAVAAARDRQSSRDRQSDQRLDRALRALSGP